MKTLLESMVVAFSMYSRLPVPQIRWTDRNMKYCICFFPLIGAAVGGLELAAFLLLRVLRCGPWLQGAVLAVLPVAVTGGIHLDGLLDTSDALSSWQSKEKRLEIMKDSHAGAFAVIAGLCFFTLYTGFLSEAEWRNMLVLAPGFILSRACSGLALALWPKAKSSGLARTFSDAAANRKVAAVMIFYIAAVSCWVIFLSPVKGLVFCAAVLLILLWYRYFAIKTFGGITGDTEGFFLQITELAIAAGALFF